MGKALIGVSLLAIGIALPASADTFNIPARKAGQWSIAVTPETKGAAPAMTFQLCLDATSDKALMDSAFAVAGADCSTTSSSKVGDTTIIDSSCALGGFKTKSHIELSGDFQSSYSMKITSDMLGAPPKMPAHSVMTQTATYKGECTGGLQPGDMQMPNGMKINALKAMHPGGG